MTNDHRKGSYILKAEAGSFSLTGQPARLKVIRIRDARFTEKAFNPYTLAIGQAALAWNALHERLGYVFCELQGGQTERNIKLWNSVVFDRPKRGLLEAIVKSASDDEKNQTV